MNVADVMLGRQELVEVCDGGLQLVSEQRLTLLPLSLLHQVQADDGRTIAPQARHKVKAGGTGKGRGSVNYIIYK